MLHRLLLLGLALCGIAHAATQPRIDLTVTPAWKGWSRPGRSSEVDIRLRADTAMAATLEVVAGRQSVRTELELQPGRALRLHIPVSSAERVGVSVGPTDGALERRDIGIARSESPLLGVGLVAGGPVQLEGFHAVALSADDLPRHASAYSSIDALILDAPTLAALDQRQLGALLAHAAACGHIVVLNTDARVRRLLDGASECSGHALMGAASLTEAMDMLRSSLATRLTKPMSLAGIGELARPDHLVWNRVALALAMYFAAAVLALIFFASFPVLLLMPALGAAAVLALLHATQAPAQLVVWGEGKSGAPLARYQAWQRFPGAVRERIRVRIPPQLSASAQPCNSAQAIRFDIDARSGQAMFAEFETRLFHQVSLCYSGSFPMARAIAIEARDDGVSVVRNVGAKAWPEGALLVEGLAHDLPALGPGAHATVAANVGRAAGDAARRTAVMRTRPDGAAALWKLELSGVADIPIDSQGWLLVSVPSP